MLLPVFNEVEVSHTLKLRFADLDLHRLAQQHKATRQLHTDALDMCSSRQPFQQRCPGSCWSASCRCIYAPSCQSDTCEQDGESRLHNLAEHRAYRCTSEKLR